MVPFEDFLYSMIYLFGGGLHYQVLNGVLDNLNLRYFLLHEDGGVFTAFWALSPGFLGPFEEYQFPAIIAVDVVSY